MIDDVRTFLQKYWSSHLILSVTMLLIIMIASCASCAKVDCMCGHTKNYHSKDYYSECSKCECLRFVGK